MNMARPSVATRYQSICSKEKSSASGPLRCALVSIFAKDYSLAPLQKKIWKCFTQRHRVLRKLFCPLQTAADMKLA